MFARQDELKASPLTAMNHPAPVQKTPSQPSIEEFLTAARRFCLLVEDQCEPGMAVLGQIRQALLQLLFHIPAVESAEHSPEHDGNRPDEVLLDQILKRFCCSPFNYYMSVFNPHDMTAEHEPGTGMLADDLTDIYANLSEGLDLANAGHLDSACFAWSQSYQSHWARHAVQALTAIEMYRLEHSHPVEEFALETPSPCQRATTAPPTLTHSQTFRLIAVPLLASVVILRSYLHLVQVQHIYPAGYLIHHLFTGTLILIPAAFILAFGPQSRWLAVFSRIAVGIGAGLILDELAFLVMTDASDAGYISRTSWIGATICTAAGLVLLYLLYHRRKSPPLHVSGK